MPTYEYLHSTPRKRGCPKQFELVRKVMERDDPALCPKCGNPGHPGKDNPMTSKFSDLI